MEKSAFLELAKASGISIIDASRLPDEFDDPKQVNKVQCDRPRLLFAIAMSTMRYQIQNRSEYLDIHPTASIENYDGIGVEGVGFEIDGNGKRWLIPQVGKLVIGQRVRIGEGVIICRGTIDPTIIADDVIIAHGSALGHNCEIGARTFIANNATLAGSVKTATDCFIGSGAVIKNKVEIGKKTVVGCGAVVVDSYPGRVTLVGNPARPLE